jgi:hypothetical protein
MFNCVELVTQQLRKFRATFASVVVASSCAKKKLSAAHEGLWRKFEEIAFDDSSQARWETAMKPPADNIDVGPITEADLCEDLFKSLENPF